MEVLISHNCFRTSMFVFFLPINFSYILFVCLFFSFIACQDDRSPLSSGESSDESSSVEVAGPSHIHEQILRRQRQQQPKKQEAQQQQHKQQQSVQTRDDLGVSILAGNSHFLLEKWFSKKKKNKSNNNKNWSEFHFQNGVKSILHGDNNNLNNLLYPAALVNLPQEVLMNLVQSGRLQVEEEGMTFSFFFLFSSSSIQFDFLLIRKKKPNKQKIHTKAHNRTTKSQ